MRAYAHKVSHEHIFPKHFSFFWKDYCEILSDMRNTVPCDGTDISWWGFWLSLWEQIPKHLLIKECDKSSLTMAIICSTFHFSVLLLFFLASFLLSFHLVFLFIAVTRSSQSKILWNLAAGFDCIQPLWGQASLYADVCPTSLLDQPQIHSYSFPPFSSHLLHII